MIDERIFLLISELNTAFVSDERFSLIFAEKFPELEKAVRNILTIFVEENERLRRELNEAKETSKKKQIILDEWLNNYQRWIIENIQLAPHAKVLEKELAKKQEQIVKLEGELKEAELYKANLIYHIMENHKCSRECFESDKKTKVRK